MFMNLILFTNLQLKLIFLNLHDIQLHQQILYLFLFQYLFLILIYHDLNSVNERVIHPD
jgi:hypothetical protein